MSSTLLEALRTLGVADVLPPGLEQRLGGLAFAPGGADEIGDLKLQRGDVTALDPAALPGLDWLPIEAPDLAGPSGLPVQLAVELGGGGAVERWAIDLRLDRLRLVVPGLRPAREVEAPGGSTRLEEDTAASEVAIVGKGVLRVAAAAGAAPEIGLVEALDSGDPFGVSGAVVELKAEPSSFFLGSSSFGFTVAALAYDDSGSDSPAPKPGEWRGLAVREATLFLPPGAPVVGDASLAVKDLFLGNPTGVEGSASVELPAGDPAHGNRPYSVRIEVEWHDAGARGLAEAVPSRAEAIVSWPGGQLPLPGGGSAAVTAPGAAGTPPAWVLRGRWGHDDVAGSDEFTLTLDVAGSPEGIAQISGRPLAGALGLAPALLGAASSSIGDAATVRALITALGAAAGVLLRDGSRTIVNNITIDHLERASGEGSRTRLTVDYTVELGFQVEGAGLPVGVSTLPGRPMKLRYHGVGVEIDANAGHWYNRVGLIMDGVVPEVVDPGAWQLSPPLDDLLRVTGVRSGAQSQWLEVELAMAADLGVVELSKATVRVVFGEDGIDGLELRGLRAAVSVPGVIEGEGALDVSNGAIRAGVGVTVQPLGLAARADLALEKEDMVALAVGVRFPAAIPFANSGLGLFGLMGRFVSNGQRALDSGIGDPVQRELKWLETAPAEKYVGKRGRYAMGLGAVIGTVPDAGFTLNAVGMVTVEFPRPAVILGVFAKVFSGTAPEPTDQATPPGSGVSLTGLVVIDEKAVTIALRGYYKIEELIEIDVPLGAWFPFARPADSRVHLGADGQLPDRSGPPVTVTLLPNLLKQRVWAFVMVHGNGLQPGLMGKPEFVFGGFAIGFGAGWEIDWSAGPIRLRASAMVLAGVGTEPLLLAAGIWVRGSLDLVVLSISARGEITLLTDGRRTELHGKFCGEVDLFFFSISGCVGIDIGASPLGPRPASSPISGVDLVSRVGTATARAVRAGTGEPPRAWPDAIPVIHFSHFVRPDVGGGSFKIGQPMPGPVWSGSRDLKYAYRITEVRLESLSGPPFQPPPGKRFESAWWWPGVRPGDGSSLSAKNIETRDLALLDWQPWRGMLPLTEPDRSPADPAGPIGSLCDPVANPHPLCVLGSNGRRSGAGGAVLVESPDVAVAAKRPPARLVTEQPGGAGGWEGLLALAGVTGVAVEPAAVRDLDEPASTPSMELGSGWRLAGLRRSGQPLGSLALEGRYDPPLEEATLVLEVCPVERPEVSFKPFDLPEELVGEENAELIGWIPGREEQPQPPPVTGVHADGSEVEWEAEVVREGHCIEVHYAAPSAGPWVGVKIDAAPGRHVTLVASCGVHWELALEWRQAEQQRTELSEAFAAHAMSVGSLLGQATAGAALPVQLVGPKRPLLPANTEFLLAVTWEWQAWSRKEGGPTEPGPLNEEGWQPGGSDEFRFRTAGPADAVAPPPPVDLIGEASFDPRGVARYVTGAIPTGELPHLLDDPIRVTFSVDYLPALLSAYKYETRLEVLPTDVAPGSLVKGQRPPNVADAVTLVTWIGDGVLTPVERRALEAIETSPCLPNGQLGGSAAEVAADLEPDTAYDLILLAAQGEERRTIRRFHFRTSRYRDVGELLEALALPPGAPGGPGPPDVLLTASWPPLYAVAHDDAAFEQALRDLELDPWPLSAEPRTTVLWVRIEPVEPALLPEWRLGGVLLEAPEPIARAGRIAVRGSVGTESLAHVRGTSSGTRVLLAPPQPIPVGAADALTVRLEDALRGRVAEGGAPLHGGPRTIREEVG